MSRRLRLEGLPWPSPSKYGMALRSFSCFQPQLAAGLGLTIERLRDRGRSAYFADGKNLYLEIAAVVLHLQQIAGADFACGFGPDSVGFDPAQLASVSRQGARLEESGCPEPLVDAHAYSTRSAQ